MGELWFILKNSAWAYPIKCNQGRKYKLQFCHNKIVFLLAGKNVMLDIFKEENTLKNCGSPLIIGTN